MQAGAAYLADSLGQGLPGFLGAKLPVPVVNGLPASFVSGNIYYVSYNCTMAMFQVGGEPRQRWNGAVRDRVITLQAPGRRCDRGSWPPNDQYSELGGRIYSTALAVLTLEVYYRFQRVAGDPVKAKFFEN
jgi:hypothetical protein